MARVVGAAARKAVEDTPKYRGTDGDFDKELRRLVDEIEQELSVKDITLEDDEEPWKNEEKVEKKEKKSKKERRLEKEKQKEESGEDKQEKKAKKERTNEEIGELITLKDLASELKAEPKKLRKWLRSNATQREEGRWEWSPDDPVLAKIRKAFSN